MERYRAPHRCCRGTGPGDAPARGVPAAPRRDPYATGSDRRRAGRRGVVEASPSACGSGKRSPSGGRGRRMGQESGGPHGSAEGARGREDRSSARGGRRPAQGHPAGGSHKTAGNAGRGGHARMRPLASHGGLRNAPRHRRSVGCPARHASGQGSAHTGGVRRTRHSGLRAPHRRSALLAPCSGHGQRRRIRGTVGAQGRRRCRAGGRCRWHARRRPCGRLRYRIPAVGMRRRGTRRLRAAGVRLGATGARRREDRTAASPRCRYARAHARRAGGDRPRRYPGVRDVLADRPGRERGGTAAAHRCTPGGTLCGYRRACGRTPRHLAPFSRGTPGAVDRSGREQVSPRSGRCGRGRPRSSCGRDRCRLACDHTVVLLADAAREQAATCDRRRTSCRDPGCNGRGRSVVISSAADRARCGSGRCGAREGRRARHARGHRT